MSPILVRPVREQFEHDRVIRVLQAKYKRKYEVAINPGTEQNASVGVGDLTMYPDLVLFSQERNRKIHGTIEVETTESINTLEAQAEWAPFSKLRTPFFLYVPANSIDTARRLCSEHGIDPAEIWTYHTALDQIRFTMVYRSPDAPKGTIAEHKPKPPAPVVIEPEPERPAPVPVKAPAAKVVAAKAPAAKAPAGKEATIPNGVAKAKSAASAKPAVAAKAAKTAKPAAPAKPAAKPAAPAKAAKTAKPAKSAKPAKPAKPAKAAGAAKAAKSKPAKTAKAKAKSRR